MEFVPKILVFNKIKIPGAPLVFNKIKIPGAPPKKLHGPPVEKHWFERM